MKLSTEITEIFSSSKTFEELAQHSNRKIVVYNEQLEESKSKTSVSLAGQLYSAEKQLNRENDTIRWESSVHSSVFSSDDSVVRCPVYAESNDSISKWNAESPRFIVMNSTEGISL